MRERTSPTARVIEKVFAALDGMNDASPSAPVEAREASARPDKPPMTLERLIPCYRGVFFTTVAGKLRRQA